jgi:hypothetical protein
VEFFTLLFHFLGDYWLNLIALLFVDHEQVLGDVLQCILQTSLPLVAFTELFNRLLGQLVKIDPVLSTAHQQFGSQVKLRGWVGPRVLCKVAGQRLIR